MCMHCTMIAYVSRNRYSTDRGDGMRTTLEIPDALIEEAMALTHIPTKTDVIKTALQGLIQREKIRDLKNYYGKIDLDIDLDSMRQR